MTGTISADKLHGAIQVIADLGSDLSLQEIREHVSELDFASAEIDGMLLEIKKSQEGVPLRDIVDIVREIVRSDLERRQRSQIGGTNQIRAKKLTAAKTVNDTAVVTSLTCCGKSARPERKECECILA